MRHTEGIDGSWWVTPPEGVRITVGNPSASAQGAFTVVLNAHETREAKFAATVLLTASHGASGPRHARPA